MSFQNLFVPQEAQGQLSRVGVMTVPTFFVVDASGTLRYTLSGSLKYGSNYSRLQQEIQSVR